MEIEVTACLVPFGGPGTKSSGCSLAQLFHIFRQLDIKSFTNLYYDKPRPDHAFGIFCKNLFLKDRKGQFYLVIWDENEEVDLKKLKSALKAYRNFNFGNESELQEKLGLTRGSITPFGLIMDKTSSVKVVVQRSIADSKEFLNFHPLVNFLTTALKYDDLEKFIGHCNHEIVIVDL